MDAQGRFLVEVGERLPLPREVREEVLEELAGHLADATAELVRNGRNPATAEREAIARLGSPATLAGELARARHRPAQLLAAAGAGTWAAVRNGILGTLLGWTSIAVVALAAMAAARAVGGFVGIIVNVSWDAAWNTVLTAVGLNVGALLAGSAAVRAAAAAGWRTPGEVRAAVIVPGSLAAAWVALVVFEQTLNWASVVALLLVPVSFGIGARFERLRLPSAWAAGVPLLVGLGLFMAFAAVGSSGSGATFYQWDDATRGDAMIGPWWQDPASTERLDFPSADYGSLAPGVVSVSVDGSTPDVISEFQRFQLEAWRTEPPADGWRLVPGQQGPFATAEASLDGSTVVGSLRFDQTPGVDWAEVVLTAVGPDGTRYILSASGPEQTEFRGSVWAWFSALVR